MIFKNELFHSFDMEILEIKFKIRNRIAELQMELFIYHEVNFLFVERLTNIFKSLANKIF